jgi:hypothetical protein
MFTPGLTSAPMLALELLTPTFASTPTFGFTLSEFEVVLLDDLLPLEELSLPVVPFRFVLLLEELEDGPDCEEPFRSRSMLVELELWFEEGAEALPFRLMSVELEELEPGVVETPLPPCV